MHSPLLEIHASWMGLPPEIETSDTWRWLHLRHVIDSALYETLLLHCADISALTVHEILNVLFLSVEALTRNGDASERCDTVDVEWARRTGLALFGAALRLNSDYGCIDRNAALRLMLSFMSQGERAVALLSLDRESSNLEPEPLTRGAMRPGPMTDVKLQRLIDLCRERIKSTGRNRIQE
ncbi:MAG: hypothetical protein JWQ11_4907 [Rhizobacter sp.]|nr:hypothetical protein [Rhizobacter sp.]